MENFHVQMGLCDDRFDVRCRHRVFLVRMWRLGEIKRRLVIISPVGPKLEGKGNEVVRRRYRAASSWDFAVVFLTI